MQGPEAGGVQAEVRDAALQAHVLISAGASEEQIRSLESACGFRLPAAFRALYRLFDGFAKDEYDEHFIRFWGIEEILSTVVEGISKSDTREFRRGIVCFADYSLDAHQYAIDMTRDAAVVLWGGTVALHCADNVEQFLEFYLRSPKSLFLNV